MEIGDLVRVNSDCDAGGLWHETGIVVETQDKPGHAIEGPFGERAVLVRVFLQGRLHLFNIKHLDIINESG